AITQLSDTHPALSKLSAQLERIEREQGRDELETWRMNAGHPEWEAFCEQRDGARDALLMILMRNGEHEIVQASRRWEAVSGREDSDLRGVREHSACLGTNVLYLSVADCQAL